MSVRLLSQKIQLLNFERRKGLEFKRVCSYAYGLVEFSRQLSARPHAVITPQSEFSCF